MATQRGRRLPLILAGPLLSGCSTPAGSAPSASTTEAVSPTPPAAPSPSVAATIDTTAVGEAVSVPEATLTVRSVKKVSSYPTECGTDYKPKAGRSLVALQIRVTNDGNDVAYPDGQFIGSAAVTVRDSGGKQMAFAFPGCVLKGEGASSDGLASGETESLPILFEGPSPDSQAGWMELDSGDGSDPQVVLLDPDLTLTSN